MFDFLKDKNELSVFYALMTYIIWGIEAPMAIWFGSNFGINNIIVYSFIFIFVFTFFILYIKKINAFKVFNNLNFTEQLLLILAGIFRGAKDSLYYVVLILFIGNSLEIITLNYLWPILLFLLIRAQSYKKEGGRFLQNQEIVIILWSVFIPFLCYKSLESNVVNSKIIFLSLLSALFGALHSFIYRNYSNIITARAVEDKVDIEKYNPKYFSLCIRSFIAISVSLLICSLFDLKTYTLSPTILSLAILFAFIQVFLAQHLYSLSMRGKSFAQQSSLTIYSVFLGFFVTKYCFDIDLNYLTVMAMVSVAFVIYFIRNLKSYFTAMDKTILILVLFSLVYYSPYKYIQGLDFSPSTEVLTGIFSIIIGFTLSRLVEKVRKEDELLTRATMELSKTMKFLELKATKETFVNFKKEANSLLRSITRYNFSPIEWTTYRTHELTRKIDHFCSFILERPDVRESDEFISILEYINSFESEIELWLAERSTRLPRGERYASWILGFFSILSFTTDMIGSEESVSAFTNLAIIAFTFTIIYLLTSVADLDINRPDTSARSLLFNQRPFKKLDLNFYIPREQISRGHIDIFSNKLTFETEVSRVDKSLINRDFRDFPFLFKVLKTATPLLMLGIILLVSFI
ncbi:hypothetical protein [Halobacteriovorax sp.]|uniref:hypothetical protein n=1 Tax=Halobacteriovorax sp. TaxID=2020862 RepID=UPI003AF2915D